MADETSHVSAPVEGSRFDDSEHGPENGIAVCLSGGGYRAMLFHVGALIRLNEARLLPLLNRVSSVSGGSITAGVLGLHWKNLAFVDGIAGNLDQELTEPLRALASITVDRGAILWGILLPWVTIADKVSAAYDKNLFHGATLQDLPDHAQGPRFVFNATNVQSGVLWRFSRPYMGDYLIGRVMNPRLPLAQAVAASSAFPPVLSPVELSLKHTDFAPDPQCPLQKEPFTTHVVLSDGGVYDNLGLETVWKRYRTVLISDAGAKIEPEPKPAWDWARQAMRINDLIDNQVRSLRKRQIMAAFTNPADDHDGTYWGIRTDIDKYHLPDSLACPHAQTLELARIPTRLKALSETEKDRLINWGYAVCDAALRKHLETKKKHLPKPLAAPTGFPFPGGVG